MRLAVVHRHMIDTREGHAQELSLRKFLQDVFLERHVRKHDKLGVLGTCRFFRVVFRRRIAVDHLQIGRQILLLQRLCLRLRDSQRFRDYKFHADPPFLAEARMRSALPSRYASLHQRFLQQQECLDASSCPHPILLFYYIISFHRIHPIICTSFARIPNCPCFSFAGKNAIVKGQYERQGAIP